MIIFFPERSSTFIEHLFSSCNVHSTLDISLDKDLGLGISFTVMELFYRGLPTGDYFLIETVTDIAYSIYFVLSYKIPMSSHFFET